MRPTANRKVLIAPAYWASYLIDRDPGQVARHEGARSAHTLERIDRWIEAIRPWSVKDVVRNAQGAPLAAFDTAVHDCAGFVDDPGCDLTWRAYFAMRTG